jgi:hypothetical protein
MIMLIKVSNKRLRQAQEARAEQIRIYRSVWGDAAVDAGKLDDRLAAADSPDAAKLLHLFLTLHGE